jgi:hypothetical protein
MYSDSACVGVGKVTLAGAQKLLYDVGRGSGSVNEHHVIVGNATLLKLGLVVLGFVQSDDSRYF